MSLNDSMGDYDRSQLAVWDYPVSDKFTKMWQAMQENSPPETFDEAIKRVKNKDDGDGFAFLGKPMRLHGNIFNGDMKEQRFLQLVPCLTQSEQLNQHFDLFNMH